MDSERLLLWMCLQYHFVEGIFMRYSDIRLSIRSIPSMCLLFSNIILGWETSTLSLCPAVCLLHLSSGCTLSQEMPGRLPCSLSIYRRTFIYFCCMDALLLQIYRQIVGGKIIIKKKNLTVGNVNALQHIKYHLASVIYASVAQISLFHHRIQSWSSTYFNHTKLSFCSRIEQVFLF